MAKDTPYISARKWIKWGDKPAGEDTDTQVLTTSLKHFVDTRIFLDTSPSTHLEPSSTPLPLSRLQWGFAGTSKSTPATESKPAHTVWTHWIDSKTAEEVRDEGDMFPSTVNKEGEEVTLETGAMEGPGGGVEAYEECWVDRPAVKLPGEEKRGGWVIKGEGEGGGKGMIIRIGGVVAGVWRGSGGEIGVRRWRWDGKGWVVELVIGELEAPVGGEGFGKIGMGEIFVKDGVSWECVEVMEW